MTHDNDTLLAIAERATPGPWFKCVNDLIGGWCVANVDLPASEIDTRGTDGTNPARVPADMLGSEADATFIATFNPDRIKAMLAREKLLVEALEGLESAVRIFDVMLNEPATKGLMTPEDYESYFGGAWLGVAEAADKARAALSEAEKGEAES